MSYVAYIQSERWVKRKQAYYARHARKCRACGMEDDVELHHRTYERMGFELDSDLVPLCAVHHAVVHDMHQRLGGTLFEVTRKVIAQIRAEANGRTSVSRKPRGRKIPRKKRGDSVSAAFNQMEEALRQRDRVRRRNGRT